MGKNRGIVRREELRNEANVRREKRSRISDSEQIKNLDNIFGEGKGAKKERARLSK